MPRIPKQFYSALNRFMVLNRDEQARERARRNIRSRLKVATEPDPDRRCLGDLRLSRLRWYLNSMGFQRSADQMNFHEHFIQAVLPLIYGDEWDQNSVRVMREFGITELKSEVLCMTPRRFGKSWAIAMFVLAMMLAVPGIKLAVFSPGSRASGSLMKLVQKFMRNIPDAMRRDLGGNKERIYIAAREMAEGVGRGSKIANALQNAADTSELACFPSSKKGTCVVVCVCVCARLYVSVSARQWWWWWRKTKKDRSAGSASISISIGGGECVDAIQ